MLKKLLIDGAMFALMYAALYLNIHPLIESIFYVLIIGFLILGALSGITVHLMCANKYPDNSSILLRLKNRSPWINLYSLIYDLVFGACLINADHLVLGIAYLLIMMYLLALALKVTLKEI